MARVLAFGSVLALGLAALRAAPAHAACPPAVALTGDAAAVRAVRAQLDARGITGETPRCPVVRARVERRGALWIVGIERRADDAPPDAASVTLDARPGQVERAVGEPATAATVIESWVRSDLAAPLLETRAVPELEAEPAVAAPAAAGGGIQLFAAEETSLASDGTVWQGMLFGACVRLGPICGAARVHGGKVIGGPGRWDRFVRKGGALYIGVDVPLAIGRNRLTPGFAAGYGGMFIHQVGDREETGVEISGLRAAAHIAFTIPVTARLALDLATTAELTQATGMATHGDASDATVAFPEEPRALFRFAVGIRYGAL